MVYTEDPPRRLPHAFLGAISCGDQLMAPSQPQVCVENSSFRSTEERIVCDIHPIFFKFSLNFL